MTAAALEKEKQNIWNTRDRFKANMHISTSINVVYRKTN